MSVADIRALTFDTGGTILDWHTGFSEALAAAGRIPLIFELMPVVGVPARIPEHWRGDGADAAFGLDC